MITRYFIVKERNLQLAYSIERWESAKDYYETGKLTLEQIKVKTGISVSKISERAKREKWEKGRTSDYIDAKVTLADKRGIEKGKTIQILEEVSYDEITNRNLVFGVTQKALKKLEKMVDSVDNASDLKTIIDASDRASLTLKVNERFAKTENNNINAFQQVSEIKISDA